MISEDSHGSSTNSRGVPHHSFEFSLETRFKISSNFDYNASIDIRENVYATSNLNQRPEIEVSRPSVRHTDETFSLGFILPLSLYNKVTRHRPFR